ncbi:hypothetical protein E4U42_006532 [Claviceps africana]|uniref:Mediator of RNA polymerase II transcription subunit 1 n=1 Tax=Claviceps africana TaxID=83212 RepID=A0A8K0NEY1_9HYPO|nr:hypothetical protein E4U42_006532 [Claviceps africana]
MATPTPMKHASSQQGRTPSQFAAATPPVSTPFSNAAQAVFTPRGPRSSPQQVKKSPATSNFMSHSGMAAFNFDSPSTAAAMGALGMGASFDIGLDNVGVTGLDAIGAALANEDDKLKRLDAIIDILSTKKGLVSEASLERLAQRIGLELLSEEQRTPQGRKIRTLAIAGSAIALDIALDNNVVSSVSLAYHGSAPSVAEHMDTAGHILLKDLTIQPGQSPLTKTLESFASNFERLASLDKLSIVPGLDCHEALAGIYTSLSRLYQWDLSTLREDSAMKDKSDAYLGNVVMCCRHGRPAMHDRDRVGLVLQYWKQHRYTVPRADDADLASWSAKRDKVWSLLLGCAALDGMGLPPVRVSDNWISNNVTREDATFRPPKTMLDWQEPDNISLPPSDDNKDAGMDLLQPDLSTTRVPRVMFTVTFDPPVVLPQNDWARLYMCAGVNPPNIQNEMLHRGLPPAPPTFDSLVFPFPPGVKMDPSEPRAIPRRRQLRHGLDDRVTQHSNTLFIYKPIYSQTVSEMPFSHPRQLLDMLPLLRQYAFLSTLLENSFGSQTTAPDESSPKRPMPSSPSSLSSPSSPTPPPPQGEGWSRAATKTKKDQLSDFIDDEDDTTLLGGAKQSTLPGRDSTPIHLDVVLWVHPVPQMQVVFPMRQSTANISLKILEGGLVEILDDNILAVPCAADADEETKRRRGVFTREKLARVLEHLEDLCKWAEWIRQRL